MCLGTVATLTAAWDEEGVRVGRLADGSVVPLSFVAGAEVGAQLLVHLGVPVEILPEATAREALELRSTGTRGGAR